MIPLYRARLTEKAGFPFDELIALVIDTIRSLDSFPSSDDLETFEIAIELNPEDAVAIVVGMLAEDSENGFKPWLGWLEDAKLLSRLERLSTPDMVLDAVVRSVDEEQWPSLIAHIDFTKGVPDPLLRSLIERSQNEALLGRAAFRFIYPETGCTGPQSAYLRTRKEVAASWIEATSGEDEFQEWMQVVLAEIDSRITAAENEEAERGY